MITSCTRFATSTAAAAFYRRLGFTVGARNVHPWGTHNHIVQLPGFFIELLAVAEPQKLAGEGFATLFGAFNQAFLQRREGLSFLMLESRDAEADARDFAAAGIAASPALRFEREGSAPDGSKLKVGFGLAFARDALAPAIGFATCRQHHPENFWNPSFQQHANGACAIAGAVIVAENPSDHHIFLSAFTGERELNATSSGITAPTRAASCRSWMGRHSAVISACRRRTSRTVRGWRRFGSRCAMHAALIAALDAGAVPHILHMGHVVIAPQNAMGATLVFAAPQS